MPPNITDKINVSIVPVLRCFRSIRRGEIPKDNQPVFYYFDISGKIYSGFYEKCKQLELGTHVFYGDNGFLIDDVDLWIPRSEGDDVPELPGQFGLFDRENECDIIQDTPEAK